MNKSARPPGPLPVNTHIHVPPNASSDATVPALLAQARSEGLLLAGTSNFFDMQVFPEFTKQAVAHGILPLLGVEVITVDQDLANLGWTVHDPYNPGRYYLQGRSLNLELTQGSATQTPHRIRRSNDARAARQVELLAEIMSESGLPFQVTAQEVISEVATNGQLPEAWVSLQERHIAGAFAERLLRVSARERSKILQKAFGQPVQGSVEDQGALQAEIRARLLKDGQPAFVPDSTVTFAEGFDMILELGGVPTYCAVADGVSPMCDYEASADALARRLRESNLHAAELVTIRNTSKCVDKYVRAFQDAGMIVSVGNEHNTPERAPLIPACADGPLSDFAADAFWEGASVLAAHQDLVSRGEPGFVDATGNLLVDGAGRRELAEYGATLILEGQENH